MARIAVLMTVHNRRDTTLRCLQSLFETVLPADHSLVVFLTDDGSTDGTAAAVRASYPDVRILQGEGQLFWGGGMRLAMQRALAESFDFYLWLNDDVRLSANAVAEALATYEKSDNRSVVVVGATRDPSTNQIGHGGFKRYSWWRPVRFVRIPPTGTAQLCDTMAGAFVLLPRRVTERVGLIDPGLKHQLGDFDYGFRARSLGCRILLMPGYAGECAIEEAYSKWRSTKGFSEAWALLDSPKGFPVKDWLLFCRRHAGLLWPLYFAMPYVRHICSIALFTWMKK